MIINKGFATCCLLVFVKLTSLPVLLYAQESRSIYLYDDLGRLAKVVDRSTGECAIYNYDAVGNILSISRQGNCAVPPTIESLTPVPENNSFTLTGQNLLGATVTVDVPNVYVSDVRASDGTLTFRLRGSEIVCESVGRAVITTPFGSVETTITSIGAAHLTLGRALAGSITQVGQTNFYCLDLPLSTAALVEVVPAAGSSVLPCVSVFRDVKAPPIPDGTACATPSVPFAIVDTDIAAGLHFIAVSGTNFTTGAYTIVVKPPLVLAQAAVDVALPNDGPTSGLAIVMTAPIIEAALPGDEGTSHYPVSFAYPIVDVVFPAQGTNMSGGGGITLAVPPVEVNFEGGAGLLNVPLRAAPARGGKEAAPKINPPETK